MRNAGMVLRLLIDFDFCWPGIRPGIHGCPGIRSLGVRLGAELRHAVGPRGRRRFALRVLGFADILYVRLPARDVSVELRLAGIRAGLGGGLLELLLAIAERRAIDIAGTLVNGAGVVLRTDALTRGGAAAESRESRAQRKKQG